MIAELKKEIPAQVEILEDCRHKLKLFMAHRVRVVNQRLHIDMIMATMLRREMWLHAHFVLDFKMKFEPVYHLEMTVQHYGKRGEDIMMSFEYRHFNVMYLQVSPGTEQCCICCRTRATWTHACVN